MMNHLLNSFFGKPPKPSRGNEPRSQPLDGGTAAPKPRKRWKPGARSLEFEIQGDRLVKSYDSVEGFYSDRQSRLLAQRAFEFMREPQSLFHQDGSPADVDDRKGHIVLPDWGFESHGKGQFHYTGGTKGLENYEGYRSNRPSEAQSDGAVVTAKPGGTTHVTGVSSVWDKTNNIFVIEYHQEHQADFVEFDPNEFDIRVPAAETRTGFNPSVVVYDFDVQKREVSSHIASQSNNRAKTFVPNQEEAKSRQANRLLKAADAFKSFAESIDQTALDLNKEPGVVVAPEVLTRELPESLRTDNPLWDEGGVIGGFHDSRPGAYGGKTEHVGIELNDEGLSVYADSYPDDRTSSSLHFRTIDGKENIFWKRSGWDQTFEQVTLLPTEGKVEVRERKRSRP